MFLGVIFWANRYFICCSAPCWSCWSVPVCPILNTPTSTNVPLCVCCARPFCIHYAVTVLCLCWLCAGLCCVPVVFDSGRCSVPHGHQFSTDPTRGRQRAELISIHFKYWNLILAYLVTLSLQLHFSMLCVYMGQHTHPHTYKLKSSDPFSVSAWC